MVVYNFIRAVACVVAISGATVLFFSHQQKALSASWGGMRGTSAKSDPIYGMLPIDFTAGTDDESYEEEKGFVAGTDKDVENYDDYWRPTVDDLEEDGWRLDSLIGSDNSSNNNTKNPLPPVDDLKEELPTRGGLIGSNNSSTETELLPVDDLEEEGPALDSMIGSYHNSTVTELPSVDYLKDWPRLDSLIGDMDANISGYVEFMLDFAIVAHPKTATTAVMNWLSSHPEIEMHKYELSSLAVGKPAEFVSQLYDLKPGRQYKRGYKAPRDLVCGASLNAIAKYWPRTKLIVGLRHPVLWFESFYNFRIHSGYKMPPAETLIGKLKDPMFGVSTNEAKFHLHLDNLGKTARSPEELKLLSWGNENRLRLPKMKNPVFLYEINQLHDTNLTRAEIYRTDLKHFLGLKIDLEPMATSASKSSSKTIDICDPKLRFVRAELMKNARQASTWIRTYFLKSPDVIVSSPTYFNELLALWMTDPCSKR